MTTTPIVVVGCGDVIVTSNDGVTWSSVAYPDHAPGLTQAAFGGGYLSLVGSFPINFDDDDFDIVDTYSSLDGVTWSYSPVTPGVNGSFWCSEAYGNGHFVVVSSGYGPPHKGYILSSPDASAWTLRTQGGSATQGLAAVGYSGGQFIAITDYAGATGDDYTQTSADGLTWTKNMITGDAAGDATMQAYAGVGFDDNSIPLMLVPIIDTGISMYGSSDGVNWATQATSTGDTDLWSRPAYRASGTPMWAMVGRYQDLGAPDSDTDLRGCAATSPDGSTWTIRQIPIGTWLDIVWFEAAGLFIAAGSARSGHALRIATSPDGITWTIQSPGAGVDLFEGSMAVHDGSGPAFNVDVAETAAAADVWTAEVPYEPAFPADISFAAVGGSGWKTRVTGVSSGGEYRQGQWNTSLSRWVVSHRLRTAAQKHELLALHMISQGKVGMFRFRDWTDYIVALGTGVLINYRGVVVLAKRYLLYDVFGTGHEAIRPISKPERYTVVFDPAGPIVNYDNGVVTGGTVGVTTWTGNFEIPVRFDTDATEIAMKQPTAWGWAGIPLIEARFDPSEDGLF